MKNIPFVSKIIHYKMIQLLHKYNVNKIIDMGGTGKINLLDSSFDVTNANLKQGINCSKLPFKDNEFDAAVSIATLEHVEEQKKFIDESIRVAKRYAIHWFPMGNHVYKIEALKQKYSFKHPITKIPLEEDFKYIKHKYKIYPFLTYLEHLGLLMEVKPQLDNDEIYNFIIKNYNLYYGTILEIKK